MHCEKFGTIQTFTKFFLIQCERIYCHISEHWKKGRDLNLAIFAKQTSPKHPECNVMQYQHVVQQPEQSSNFCVCSQWSKKEPRKRTQLMEIMKCSKAAPALILFFHTYCCGCLTWQQVTSTSYNLLSVFRTSEIVPLITSMVSSRSTLIQIQHFQQCRGRMAA